MIDSADVCRKRADECLAAAHYASDHDIKRTWRQLSEMWLLWAEQVANEHRSLAAVKAEIDRISSNAIKAEIDRILPNAIKAEVGGASSAEVKADNSVSSMVAAAPIIERTYSTNRKVTELADRLRVRLALLPAHEGPRAFVAFN